MRQGQQNRRGRGRTNNSNRKGGHHNPLSRSFESNGPDVKIRGTPAHIAEKYLTLARDAQSSGDPVLEQNYLQHAEHYNRIIMAYRDQFNQPDEGGMNGGGQRMRGPGDTGEGFDDAGDDDMAGDDGGPQPFAQAPSHQGHQPQPQLRPHEVRQPGGEHGRPERAERPERSDQRSDRPSAPTRVPTARSDRTVRSAANGPPASATATAASGKASSTATVRQSRASRGPSEARRQSVRPSARPSRWPSPPASRAAATASSSRTSSPSSCAARCAGPVAAARMASPATRASRRGSEDRRVQCGEAALHRLRLEHRAPGVKAHRCNRVFARLAPRDWHPNVTTSIRFGR